MAEDQAAQSGTLSGTPHVVASDRLDQLAEQRRRAQGSRFWRRLRAEKKAFLGLIFVASLAVIAVIGPWVAPYHPDNDDFELMEGPSRAHLMGTDSFGRDLFSRVLIGTRVSFTIGVVSAIAAMVVGVTMGVLAGYYGGWVDTLVMRAIDLIWAFPAIILTIGLVAVFGAGARNVVIAIVIANLISYSRIVRGEVLRLRTADFTIAAHAIGVPDLRIMLRHILPNVAAPVIVQTTLVVGFGILTESGLSFLGLGVEPTTPTWGLALNESRDFIRQAWWMAVFPGLAIGFTVLSLNLFGDGLRDALDVHSVGDV